jgi:hypothetical protein
VFLRNDRRFARLGSEELLSAFVVAAPEDSTVVRVRFFMSMLHFLDNDFLEIIRM